MVHPSLDIEIDIPNANRAMRVSYYRRQSGHRYDHSTVYNNLSSSPFMVSCSPISNKTNTPYISQLFCSQSHSQFSQSMGCDTVTPMTPDFGKSYSSLNFSDFCLRGCHGCHGVTAPSSIPPFSQDCYFVTSQKNCSEIICYFNSTTNQQTEL